LDLQHLRDDYRLEIEQRRDLTSALSLPVAAFTVIGGVLGIQIVGFSYAVGWLTVVFSVSLLVTGGLFAVSISNLARSFLGYEYQHVPTPRDQKDYLDGLRAHYIANGEPAEAAEQEFRDFLIERYIEAIGKNSLNNKDKAEYLHQSNRFLVWVLLGALASGLPYVVDSKLARSPTHRVEVTNLESLQNAARPPEPAAAAPPADTSAETGPPAERGDPRGPSSEQATPIRR